MAIRIQDDKAEIIRESIELEKRVMSLSLKEHARDLKAFERKHDMKTEKFVEKFNSGKLGDESEWFDWLFAHKAHLHIKERLHALKSIGI